ncbi:DUF2971 domain-containing protein [Paraburkholderia heleia]|uniref:DUF2971 domain-containing protein n=1 Tax=Paraburkholderia heleia TaxID=634127 RepID=UPI0006944603|nr:DUF2971 domain-containing protein [Paraburkholderia heleia]
MRLYHYTKASYALETLRTGHLKVATLKNLNDPFELLSLTFETKDERKIQRKLKEFLEPQVGLLCLSRSSSEPVMWSHYADCHRGMVLAFDTGPEGVHPVSYRKTRKPYSLDVARHAAPQLEPVLLETLVTKSSSWAYEQEWRKFIFAKDWIPKDGPNMGAQGPVKLQFYDFQKDMKLVGVLIGPDCSTTVSDVKAALAAGQLSASVTKTRRAFKSFGVVRDRSGKRASP